MAKFAPEPEVVDTLPSAREVRDLKQVVLDNGENASPRYTLYIMVKGDWYKINDLTEV